MKEINDSFIELQIYNQNDSLVSNVKINHNDLIVNNDTKDFYLDENNMKNIRYMNVHDGLSCEREIYHRIRTPFMNFRYYMTHFSQLHIGLISTILVIVIFELFLQRRILIILFILLISFLIYFVTYLFDLINYNDFKNKIINN